MSPSTSGPGPCRTARASSSQTGNDTIWGIENVNTGSGNDTITASDAVNVINGGAGNDISSSHRLRRPTATPFSASNLVTVDLSAIDANSGTAGDQSFTLVTGAPSPRRASSR